MGGGAGLIGYTRKRRRGGQSAVAEGVVLEAGGSAEGAVEGVEVEGFSVEERESLDAIMGMLEREAEEARAEEEERRALGDFEALASCAVCTEEGVTDVLPFVEVDVKKIVSRVIERAKELCISKSVNVYSTHCLCDLSSFDGISIYVGTDIWIDHVSLSHCADGLIDAIMGSTGITISNSYFSHHDEVMLLGHSDDYLPDTVMQLKEDDMIEQQKIPDGKKEEISQVVPAWLGCFPIKGDLIEAKVVYDQLCTMVESERWRSEDSCSPVYY
ncbi:putative pectate lyase 13 [Acorus gramineus]|uniref:Pectate lyase 13 n=1 Tax=Acorus gramineus TaxID=55184 RepID=A0AAV9AEA8_ACOGR|nr:putative pectate lyase 13 [Acorus gramineus]